MTHSVTRILTLPLAATLSMATAGAQAPPDQSAATTHQRRSCLRSDRKWGECLHHFVSREADPGVGLAIQEHHRSDDRHGRKSLDHSGHQLHSFLRD